MTKPKFTDRDLGYKAIRARWLKGGRPVVEVGILGENREREDGVFGNVELGATHEFGGGNAPERSFLRATVDERVNAYRRFLGRIGRQYVDGKMTLARGLGLLGLKVVADVRKRITDGISPPLEDATKKRKEVGGKAGDTPLVDTGQLINSIAHRVKGAA